MASPTNTSVVNSSTATAIAVAARAAVAMILSEEAIIRWKKSIENHTPFEKFRKFEQLRPYMSQDEIARLDRVLEIQNAAFESKALKAK